MINNHIPGRNQMGGREEQRRTRDERTVSAFQGRMSDVRIGCRNFAKGAMRHFWIIANRGFVACAERFFGEVPGKIFGEIVPGKIWGI